MLCPAAPQFIFVGDVNEVSGEAAKATLGEVLADSDENFGSLPMAPRMFGTNNRTKRLSPGEFVLASNQRRAPHGSEREAHMKAAQAVYPGCDLASVTKQRDSGYPLCRASWGKTIGRTRCIRRLGIHSHQLKKAEDCVHGQKSLIRMAHFQAQSLEDVYINYRLSSKVTTIQVYASAITCTWGLW